MQDIIILGDLNNDLLVNNRSKNLNDLINTYNLKQLINEPTHFTESSSSLIDVVLVNKMNNILASEVCDPFIPNLIRFHCPVAVLLKFLKPIHNCYTRKIWKYDQGDYIKYRQLLSDNNWDKTLVGDVDIVSNKISSVILESAYRSIPNKTVTIRPRDPPWMHNEIRNLIRRRMRLHRKAKKNNSNEVWAKFRKLRNKINRKIRSAKSDYENHISVALQTNANNIKTWWKLSKQILNLDKGSEPIPDLKYNNITIENDQEKAEILNEYFITQSRLNDDNKIPPQLPEPTYERLNHINITANDIRDISNSLNVSKASGPDLISFIQGDSTTYQLINLYDSFCEAVDNGKEVSIPETSKHFLLDCPNYHLIRTRTLSEFLHLPVKFLLSGDPRLSENENVRIFEAVHKYIIQTKRF